MTQSLYWGLSRKRPWGAVVIRSRSQDGGGTGQRERTRGHTGMAVERDQKQEGGAGQTLACGTENCLFLLIWEPKASKPGGGTMTHSLLLAPVLTLQCGPSCASHSQTPSHYPIVWRPLWAGEGPRPGFFPALWSSLLTVRRRQSGGRGQSPLYPPKGPTCLLTRPGFLRPTLSCLETLCLSHNTGQSLKVTELGLRVQGLHPVP